MIVPTYWAEAKTKYAWKNKTRIAHRFGWSDVSQAAAEQHATERLNDAVQRIKQGEPVLSREPKIPYNGAEGVPIREEILDRQGDVILTRNGYGAHCLNTPDVLFVDIDFKDIIPKSPRIFGSLICLFLTIAVTFGWGLPTYWIILLVGLASINFFVRLFRYLNNKIELLIEFQRLSVKNLSAWAEKQAEERVYNFIQSVPEWRVRIYRTPAGLRVLAMHRTFTPDESDVQKIFDALGADFMYRKMCLFQRCFRARVSAKPWRIGINKHLTPRSGHRSSIWPIHEKQFAKRQQWVDHYESKSINYAACRFIKEIGTGIVDPKVQTVCDWHDYLCRSHQDLPIA